MSTWPYQAEGPAGQSPGVWPWAWGWGTRLSEAEQRGGLGCGAGGPLAASVLRPGGLAEPQAVGRGGPPQSGADMGPEGKQRTSPSSSTAVPVEAG